MTAFYRVEPLTDVWPEPTPAAERRSRYAFKASWSDTLSLLEREITKLDPDRAWHETNVVLQVACQPSHINKDGSLRGNAPQFAHPGVRLSFSTADHGDLSYATDVCVLWQHNVRSLALGLEALRAVDRFGISSRGQQYTGFKALPAGRAMPASHMTSDEAWSIVGSYQNESIGSFRAHHTEHELRETFRRARSLTHPDRNEGDRTLWDQVEQAGRVLGVSE